MLLFLTETTNYFVVFSVMGMPAVQRFVPYSLQVSARSHYVNLEPQESSCLEL